MFFTLFVLMSLTPAAHAQTQTQSVSSSTMAAEGPLTLDQAVGRDGQLLSIVDDAPVDLARVALVYTDPDGQATPQSISYRYLNGERTPLNQKNFLSHIARGETLWLLVPIYNRTGQTQWMIDFGDRLSGRTAPLAGVMVADLLANTLFFNQTLSGAVSGFAGKTSFKKDDQRVPLILKAKSKNLLLIQIRSRVDTPAILPLTLFSTAAPPAPHPWVQEWPYLSAAFFMAGIILCLSILAMRPFLIVLPLYLVALSLAGMVPLPLIDGGQIFNLIPIMFQICSALFLSFGICTLVKLTPLKLMWGTIQGGILVLHAAMAGAAFFLPLATLEGFFFQIGIWIPVTALSFFLCYLQLSEGDQGGFFTGGIGGLAFGAALLHALSLNQVLPPHELTLNAIPVSLFLIGPFILFSLHQTNLFVEAADLAKRRRHSSNDEAQLSKLRHAKESFDYNNLLKVIDHERRQLADARARESLRSEEMRKARDMADEANRAKSAFLAVISHEIRTPMTGVLGMVKLLLDTTLSKNQSDFVMTIKESGNAMMGLLNDILDFEKIESGKMHLEMLDFDLHRLIGGVATLMNGHATTKGIELKIDLDMSVPRYVVGDMTRLRQILLNLVGNAVKFTQKGSVTIKVSATAGDHEPGAVPSYQVYFAITDTGIGISAEGQKNIFNPFAQADKTISRKFGGSGLGLAISKRLVEAMGSQINIKSSEGQGTTFFFTLNMKEGDPAIADESLNREVKSGAENRPIIGVGQKLRVLVVEDNAITQKILRAMIEQEKHAAQICSSAEEALPYLHMGERFDLILTDIQIGGMSGYDFTAAVRKLKDPITQKTPIYALTGNVDESDIQACLKAGMNGHLAKPIDPDAFEAVLKAAMAYKAGTEIPSEETFRAAAGADTRAAQTSGAVSGVVDPELELLSTLRDSLGDDQIRELLRGLYDKAEEIIGALGRHLEEMNLTLIRDRAHELKGMSGNFGMMTLSDLAKQIEKQARDGVSEGLAELIKKLPPTYETGRQKIEDWMKR